MVLARRPAERLGDWERDPWSSSNEWAAAIEPGLRRPALLLTATLLVPLPEHALTAPTAARPGPAMTRQAKQTVKAIAEHANANAHLVADLTGSAR